MQRNIPSGDCTVNTVTICSLLGEGSTKCDIISASLSDGNPSITTSNHQTWVYHVKMASWMLLKSGLHAKKIMIDSKYASKTLPTMSQIEDALVSSRFGNLGVDYQYWLKIYARKLSDELSVHKVEELCAELLGEQSDRRVNDPEICVIFIFM